MSNEFHNAINDLFRTIAVRMGGQNNARSENIGGSRNNGEDVDMNQDAGLEVENILSPPLTSTPTSVNTTPSTQTPSETEVVMSASNITATPVAVNVRFPVDDDDDDDARSDESMPHLQEVSDSDDDESDSEVRSSHIDRRRGLGGAEGFEDAADFSEVDMMARIAEDSAGDGDRRPSVGGRSSSGPQGTRRARVEDDVEGDSERDRRHPSQRTSTPINTSSSSSNSSTPATRSTSVSASHWDSLLTQSTSSNPRWLDIPNRNHSHGVSSSSQHQAAQTSRAPDQAMPGAENSVGSGAPARFNIDFTEAPQGLGGPTLMQIYGDSLNDSTYERADAVFHSLIRRPGTQSGGAGDATPGFGYIPAHLQAPMSRMGVRGTMGTAPGVGAGATGPLPAHPHQHTHIPHLHVHPLPHARENPGQHGPSGNPATGFTERHPFAEILTRFGNALLEASQQNGSGPATANDPARAEAGTDAGVGAVNTENPSATPAAPSATGNVNPGSETGATPNLPGPQPQGAPGQQNQQNNSSNRLATFLQSLIEAAGAGGEGNVTTTASVNGITVNLGGPPDANAGGANNNDAGGGPTHQHLDHRAMLRSVFNTIARGGHIHGGTFAFDPATGGFTGGFPVFGFRPPQERDDPERARRLVDGLEEVPVGLVRRLERVARESKHSGADEGEVGGQGDGGCAICWERLIEDDDVLLKMREEEEAAKAKEKEEKERETKENTLVAHEDTQLDSPKEASSSPATSSLAVPSPAEPSSSTASSSSSPKKPRTPKYPRIIALPCAHVFHADCLIPWFSRPRQTTCPTCRFNVDPEGLTRYMGTARRATATAAPGPRGGAQHSVGVQIPQPSIPTRDHSTAATGRTNPTGPGSPPTGEPADDMARPTLLPGIVSSGWFGPIMSSLNGGPVPNANTFIPISTGSGYVASATTGPQGQSASNTAPGPQTPATAANQQAMSSSSSSIPAGSSTSPASGDSNSSASNHTTDSADVSASGTASSSGRSGSSGNVISATGSTPVTHNTSSSVNSSAPASQTLPTQVPGQPQIDPSQAQRSFEEQAFSLAQELYSAILPNRPRQDHDTRPHQAPPSTTPQAPAPGQAPGTGPGNAPSGPMPNRTQNFGPFPYSRTPSPDAHDNNFGDADGILTIGFDLIIGSGPPPPGAMSLGQFMGEPHRHGGAPNRGANGNANANAPGGANANANANGGVGAAPNQNGLGGTNDGPMAADGNGTGNFPGGLPGHGNMGFAVPLNMNGFGLGMPTFDMQPMEIGDLHDLDMVDLTDDMVDDLLDIDDDTRIDGMDVPLPAAFNLDSRNSSTDANRTEAALPGMTSFPSSRSSAADSRDQTQSQMPPQSRIEVHPHSGAVASGFAGSPAGTPHPASQQNRAHVHAPWTAVPYPLPRNPSGQAHPPPVPEAFRHYFQQQRDLIATGTNSVAQADGNNDPHAHALHPEHDTPGVSDYISTMLGRAMQGVARPAQPQPHVEPPRFNRANTRPPPRERRTWAPPPPPGLTLRQRVEKSEREAGLRCWDPSCGVGPSDEDPFVGIAESQRRQVRLRQAAAESSSPADSKGKGKEKEKEEEEKEIRYICSHTFHPPCIVSAQRVALNGAKENIVEGGRSVEVSCPVCRASGVVSKEDWEEGVRALQSS